MHIFPTHAERVHLAWRVLWVAFSFMLIAEVFIAFQFARTQHVFECGAIVTAWCKDGIRHVIETFSRRL